MTRNSSAAATVHVAISFFWSVVLRGLLPRRHTILWAIVGALAIGVLDRRVIGRLFPEVLALPFGPQLMDHVAWRAPVGVMIGGVTVASARSQDLQVIASVWRHENCCARVREERRGNLAILAGDTEVL